MQVYGGRYLNDEEITGMLIATLFAGQHTSSITSAWTGLTMIRDKVIITGIPSCISDPGIVSNFDQIEIAVLPISSCRRDPGDGTHS